MILSLLKARGPGKSCRAVYEAIVAAARHPKPYAEWGVPDTLDGRFDMIILHAVLVMDRLQAAGGEARDFAQALADEVFADMDRSLREMGVGDLSVGKKVRKMAEVFYGRAFAYRPALEAGDATDLAGALARNVFAGIDSRGAEPLAAYALTLRRHLHDGEVTGILSGELILPEP
jgi:cytochrome b pre-mRNA-processing protein 3